MKIGIDARLWNETGVGRYIRNLVLSLEADKGGHEFVLFLRDQEYKSLPLPKNFQKVKADIMWHSIAEQRSFSGIITKQDIDLMHFTYFSIPLLYNKPYVMTVHDLIIHSFPTGKASTHPLPIYLLKRQAYKTLITNRAKHAKKIIAPSFATKNEIIKRLKIDEGKIEVTYEGVDDFLSAPGGISPALQKKVGEKYFLYVGNAYPHKNVRFLVTQFLEFSKRNSGTRLVLVGKHDYFYTQLMNDFKSEKEIIFLSGISDSELSALYSNSIAVISPSLMEGFGLTPLEGLRCGTVALVSDIPVFRELLGDGVLYFDPANGDSFQQQLTVVYNLSKKDREEMIGSGKKIADRFSWKKMGKETLKIYESCARI